MRRINHTHVRIAIWSVPNRFVSARTGLAVPLGNSSATKNGVISTSVIYKRCAATTVLFDLLGLKLDGFTVEIDTLTLVRLRRSHVSQGGSKEVEFLLVRALQDQQGL